MSFYQIRENITVISNALNEKFSITKHTDTILCKKQPGHKSVYIRWFRQFK